MHGAPVRPFMYRSRRKTSSTLAPYFSSRRTVIGWPNHASQSWANRRLSSCSLARKAFTIWTSWVALYSAKTSLVATAEAAPQLNWQTIRLSMLAPALYYSGTEIMEWFAMQLRTKFAAIFSLLYLFVFAVLCIYRVDDLICMGLNELGDYLAGAFGPLALTWLVFGYFQQGDELRQGTEALKLQATELNNSVVQQAKLVAANEVALRNHENSLEPLFKIVASHSGWDEDGEFYFKFVLKNLGEYCEEIKVIADLGGREFDSKPIGAMFSGDSEDIQRSGMNEWEDFVISVVYRNRTSRKGRQSFSVISHQDEHAAYPEYRVEKHPFLSQ